MTTAYPTNGSKANYSALVQMSLIRDLSASQKIEFLVVEKSLKKVCTTSMHSTNRHGEGLQPPPPNP